MIEKQKYINRFKTLYEQKNGTTISDELAIEYFENMIVLVAAIYHSIPRVNLKFDDGK